VPLPILALLVAFVLSYFLTPIAKRLAIRLKIVSEPGLRSIHTKPMPYLGGLAIYASFALTVILIRGLPDDQTIRVLGCGFLAMSLGALDDWRDISSGRKLLGQVLVASILVGLGVRIFFVSNPFTGGVVYLGDWSYILSVLWVVAVMNVVNLADGLDGLAAGICTIAALAAAFVAFRMTGLGHVAILAAALAGSAAGFLPHNWNPAKIFMGDAGAMFLGFTLAAISMQGALKQTTTVALLVPIIALGLPITDTALAIIRRIRAGRSVGQADKGHLHHRLLNLGLGQKKAVLLMWAVTAWLGLGAVLLSEVGQGIGFALVMTLAALGIVAFVGVVTATSSVDSPSQEIKNVPK
jgi:UDP-GlcNAc:undecaprenyl-phosphate GlcNAc-1-phosphate transferase